MGSPNPASGSSGDKNKEESYHPLCDEEKKEQALEALNDGKEEEEEEEEERGTWSSRLDFVMSALSFAVGMGNIWRFPYMCYKNGGGAFLIPYLVMVVFAGFPLMFLELAFGQYASQGIVSIWKASPLFQGVGWTMYFISFISCIYYNMLIAYSFYYLFASFAADVPWRNCDNAWNKAGCGGLHELMAEKNCTKFNGTWYNTTCWSEGELPAHVQLAMANVTNQTASLVEARSPADEYFHFNMLDISEGIENLGMIKWQLALCLLLCWLIVAVCLSKGIKSSGKATYITATFPYLVLLILLVRGLTLDGSMEGIMYYITPQWDRLTSAKVWGDAAVQVFYSMSICWGGLITLASYNKFNNNCFRDSIIVAVGDCLTSVFAGVVIFAIIGYMAHELNVPVSEVATQGAGLAFIVYPSVVTRLPISPLWAILFMLMLINLGIGTQFTLVTTAHTTLLDVFSKYLRKGRRPLLLLLTICLFCYLMGLIITTRGGMYVLQLMDSYAPSYALLVVGLVETLVISWVYGLDRFFKNIELMTGSKPSKFWIICWRFITPGLILFILIFTFIDFKPSSYGKYTYPLYADIIGWCITAMEIAFIPGVAIYKICTSGHEGTLWSRIKFLSQPAEDWGPAEEVKLRRDIVKREEATIPLNIMIEKPQIA